jgi:putative pyruvate formate lyase activating enzyme
MPNGLAGTEDLMRFIVEQLSPHSYVNIMAQYRPVYQARAFLEVNRPINAEEFREALEIARTCGIHRGFE